MLLSVCIPTYNRCAFIRVSARYWLEQVASFADRVELIIADNASTDETYAVLKSYNELGQFKLIRRPKTLNFNETTCDLVAVHAQGDYVWVCGDDDYLNPGALTEVVAALENNQNQDHFYITTQFVPGDHAPDLAREDPRASSQIHRPSSDLSSHVVARTREIIELYDGDFSGFYSSIWRKNLALTALSGETRSHAPFASLEATLPYAVYIARNRLEKPCYRIGNPLITVVHTVSWPQYASFFRLKIMPDLYDLYLENGISPAVLKKHQIELLDHWPRNISNLIRRRHDFPGQKFSFIKYLVRHAGKPRFWKELFRAVWCDLLP